MHLAQINLGRLAVDLDDPRAADFLRGRDILDRILQTAPGFVWRHSRAFGDGGGALIDDDPRILISLSVWQDFAALDRFVWKTVHRQFWGRRGNWFEPPSQTHHALWWVARGHHPGVDEAIARLETRRRLGDTDQAFGWDYARARYGGDACSLPN